ncbi:MAG: ATPase [Lachnospiraceae bacterium]|nr:ATPase [Lachnospiraceae bacterium]
MIYQQILNEHERLKHQITRIQNELNKMPEGHLICAKNGKYYKYYQSDGKVQEYIHKTDFKLIRMLARKKYLTMQLKEHKRMIYALRLYLNCYSSEVKLDSTKLLLTEPYTSLLADYFSSDSCDLQEWMHEPFSSNHKFPEQLIHKTVSGHVVRSKSEALIAMVLYNHKIPFRYEASLQLGETIFYPDFTIRHPKTGEFFYWEHFGMMDDANYSKSAFSKLQYYSSFGIIPSIQLITTYETSKHPLDIMSLEKIVEQYFF